MKDMLANVLVGIPVLIFIISLLIFLHNLLGENMAPVLLGVLVLSAGSIMVGAAVRALFSSTTVMYRLKRWTLK